MKLVVLSLLAATCYAAPQMYRTVSGTLVSAQSLFPAVMKIPEPGVNLGAALSPSVHASVPVPVVNTVAPLSVPTAAPLVVAAVAPQVKAVAVSSPVVPAVGVVEPPRPLDAPAPPMPSLSVPHVGGQFHAQDETGQYSFAHYGGPNTRVENRDSLGRTSGSFAYVDPEGDVQIRKYAAAPASGFRVAASDLVEDTPEVAQVKSAFNRAFEAVKALQQGPVVSTV